MNKPPNILLIVTDQLDNVAAEPAYAEALRDLRQRTVDWLARTQDHLYNEWSGYWLTDDMATAARDRDA